MRHVPRQFSASRAPRFRNKKTPIPWKGIVLGIGLLGVTALGVSFVFAKQQAIQVALEEAARPKPPEISEAVTPRIATTQTAAADTPAQQAAALPKEFNLPVPFVLQAPHQNWDHVHEETCEEASVLMAHLYYAKKKLNADEVEVELQKMVEWQTKNLGYFEDTDAKETAEFAQAVYGFTQGKIITNPTNEEIKKWIHQGYPVILFADGRALKNPNFRNGGPPYHVLILRGWNEKGFFANDPGTRKGENFFYTYKTVQTAMADWDGEEAKGPKRVLVLYPPR